jgi:hypothetical protein
LSLAFCLAGYWWIILAVLGMMLFWLLMKGRSIFRTSSALLSIFICLAVLGVTVDLAMPLLLIACAAALAGWDLTNFGQDLIGNQRVEKDHLRSLGLAASTGLLLAFFSSSISLRIPFEVTWALVLTAVGSLIYGLQSLRRNF